MVKQIIILVGNVGSGKSEIAKQLSKKGLKHLQIDDFFPKIKRINKKVPWREDQKYFHKAYFMLFSEIKRQLKLKNSIVVDTTGASIEWKWLNKKINKFPDIKIIRIFIKVPIRILKKRIKKRNKEDKKSKKIPINFVDYISKRMKIVKPKYDYITNGNQSKRKVIEEVLNLAQL